MCISLIFIHHYMPSKEERQTDAERVRLPLELSHDPPKRFCHRQTIYLLNVVMMDKYRCICLNPLLIELLCVCFTYPVWQRPHHKIYWNQREVDNSVLFFGFYLTEKNWTTYYCYRVFYCIVFQGYTVCFLTSKPL